MIPLSPSRIETLRALLDRVAHDAIYLDATANQATEAKDRQALRQIATDLRALDAVLAGLQEPSGWHLIVHGTLERVSLAGFLRRLLPHIDHEDWRMETLNFIAMLDALPASPSASTEQK